MLRISSIGRINFIVLLALSACQPKIGDDCITNLDCSQTGDRVCDTTKPDGYCTQVDCDPISCPSDESICVAFNNTPSIVGGCNTPDKVSPYRRTFCMQTCDDEGDCRSGYACIDLSKKNAWSAAVIQEPDPDEKNSALTTVCILVQSSEEIEPGRSDQVCTGWSEEDSEGAAGSDGS